jgi:hypothetical protein
MERLKEDIDLKAEKFGHIEYYDAKLRDGYSNKVAVASKEIHELDERRKPLATVNPLFAKDSELPPTPSVEEITFEHISLNLPVIAKNALDNLAKMESEPVENNETGPAEKSTETASDETVNEDVEEILEEILTINESDEGGEDELYIFDENELNELDDESLLNICNELNIEFENESVERQDIIVAILDVQSKRINNEGNVETGDSGEGGEDIYIFDESELNEIDDESLLDICNELNIEFEDENIERQDIIAAILDVQSKLSNNK